MRFDDKEALANHVKKFCSNSDYADVNKIEDKLKSLNKGRGTQSMSNINFDDVRLGKVKDVNLEQLKGHFESNRMRFNDIQKSALRKLERDKIDETQNLKRNKEMLYHKKVNNEQMMMDLLNELKSRKDRQVRAQLEQQEIQKVLKEISRDKASALERDRRRELERIAAERENLRLREEACMDEITNLEEKKYEEERKLKEQKDRLQGKVDKSEYIQNMRKKEIEIAKERGEALAKLKHQKEVFEEDRKRIMDDLELAKNGDPAVLRRNEASRWAANDILAKGNLDFKNLQISEKDKNRLVEGQARINKLKEERAKIEKEAFPIIDELDILEKQYEDKAYNQKAQMLANDLDMRNIRPDLKANQMNHMREVLKKQEGRDLEGTTKDLANKMKTLKQNYVQGEEADPELQHRMDELQNAIKTAGQTLPNLAPAPLAAGVPPLPLAGTLPGALPGPIPGPIPGAPVPGFGVPPFANPLAGAPNPNMNYLKSQVEQQEEENKKIEEKLSTAGGGNKGGFNNIAKRAEEDIEMLKQKLLPNGFGIGMGKGADIFPEDFVFRQNDFRSEDLEVEERALLSLFYQEYDHLRMLSRLPVNSELYRYKMDQYKELSTMRAEIEKVLHEQRLEKIRRDFEKAKYEDERRYNHERWIEEQKREILAAKLRNQATNGGNTKGMTRAYSQPDLNQPPRSSHAITAYPQPQTSRYDPESRNNNAPAFINPNIPQNPKTHRPNYNAPQSARARPPETVHFQPPGTGYGDGIPESVVRDQGPEDVDYSYSPKRGLVVHFDFLTALERKHREVRLVYGVFNYTQNFNLSANKRHPNEVVANREVGVMQSEPDPANMTRNRVFFKKKHILKNIKPHAGINLIMEFQVKRTDTEPGDRRYASIGWTLMNVFDSSYELNTGQYRVPIYQTPTQPELDIRDIPKLRKIEKTMFCFRISVPKDALSKLKVLPDTHPGHYSIPRIHSEILDKEALMGNNKEMAKLEEKTRAQIKNDMEEAKLVQESYECSGINVFVHYVKNYEPTGLLRIRCTLYEGPSLIRDNNGLSCQWVTRIVHPEEAIIANQGNMEKLLKMGVYIYSETKYGKKDVVVPINDDKSWLRDFYTMLWDNNMRNEIYLNIELLVKENPYKSSTYRNLYVDDPETKLEEYTPIAATTVKCNNFDGTIRYGSYELPFFKAPLNRSDPSQNKELPYIVKVTVGQPTNQPENIPQDLFNPRKEKKSLFRNRDDQPRDEPDDFPKADNPDPFIPNEKSQIKSELFQDDMFYLYIDGARFLPENVSFSRVVATLYTSKGKEVARHVIANANIQKSTGQNPYFGLREEFSFETHPNIDPTCIAVFKIETIDRANGEQRVVGFSFFPLFMDKNIKSPVKNPKEKKYVLHNGCYQLPVFSQKPKLDPPLYIEELAKLDKLPCSSLLIRVEKAPKDDRGKPISVKNIDSDSKYELGVVTVAPKYSQGMYNTTYCQLGLTEAEIMKEKGNRPDPPMLSVVVTTQMLLGISDKMSLPELRVTLENAFNNFKAYDLEKMLDYNFFSQYIPRIGFRVSLEMMFNTDPKKLFVAVVSVNPPAAIYQKNPKFEKALLFTDIDFNSPWSAQAFNETIFTLKNMPSNQKTTLIVDIKAVNFMDKGVIQLEDYGWACFPAFEDLEIDDNPDTLELFVNSGVYMLPIFEGPVIGDFVNTVAKQPKPYEYLMEQLRRDVPPIRIKEYAGVIMKCVDNQREGHYSGPFNNGQVSLRYVPEELKSAYVFDQNVVNGLKRAPKIAKVLPKGRKPNKMKEELLNIMKAEYGLD